MFASCCGHTQVEEECGPICSVLVQNKIDQLDKAAMKTYVALYLITILQLPSLTCLMYSCIRPAHSTEVEDLARRMGLKLYRTCVRDNTLVKDGTMLISADTEPVSSRDGGFVPQLACGGRSTEVVAMLFSAM